MVRPDRGSPAGTKRTPNSGSYVAHASGLLTDDSDSVVLDRDNELQPDLFVGMEAAERGAVAAELAAR